MKNKISNDESLQLLGLFSLATYYQHKCFQAEELLCKILDEDRYGHISDAIYRVDNGPASAQDFYDALKKSGIEIQEA
jgi:uncharacterized protein YjbK